MSAFIDFRGRIDPKQIDEFIEFVAAECRGRNWPYRILDDVVKDVTIVFLPLPGCEERSNQEKRKITEEVDEKGLTHRVTKDECDGVYREKLHRRGIRIRPHYHCEVLSLIFDTVSGEVVGEQVFYPVDTPSLKITCKFVHNWDFAKTVYAGAETHRDVCEVMKRVMERFPGLNITDTADYLSTGDMEHLRSIVSAHVAAVSMIGDAFESLSCGQVLERGDRDRRIPPGRELIYRSMGPYERLTQTQRETFEILTENILKNLGYSTINRENAEKVVITLDGFIEQNRKELKSAFQEEEQMGLAQHGLAICFGACVIALFGGYWFEPPEDYWHNSPFILAGVSAARISVDPFDELARCIHARENETLTQVVDDIRFQEESYVATYDTI